MTRENKPTSNQNKEYININILKVEMHLQHHTSCFIRACVLTVCAGTLMKR